MLFRSLGLKSDLKFEYEREEERRKDAAVIKLREQIASLSKRLQKAEITPEEYILKLEEQIKLLEKQCERLEALRKELDRLKLSEHKLLADLKSSYLDVTKLKGDLLAKDYEKTQEISAMQQECAERMHELTQTLNAEKLEATAALVEEINKLQERINAIIEAGRLEKEEVMHELELRNEEYNKLMTELEQVREAKRLAEARLKSYRFKNHEITADDNYTDKESFDELENELEVFIKFYKKEWTKTKRRIRKELLNIKNIRKQDEQDNA